MVSRNSIQKDRKMVHGLMRKIPEILMSYINYNKINVMLFANKQYALYSVSPSPGSERSSKSCAPSEIA